MLLKKHFWLILLILTTVLVWALVNLVLTIISNRLEIHHGRGADISNLKTQTNTEIPPLSAYDPIIHNNIFNPGAQPQQGARLAGTSLAGSEKGYQASKLNLVLKGTAVSGTADRSCAIIYDGKTQKQGLFHVGNKIQEAVLQVIQSDRVIINRNGRQEVLTISREREDGKTRSLSPTQSMREDRSIVRQADAETYVLDRERVNDLISNVNQFMTQLRVQPFFMQGVPAGYLITDIKQGSLIEQVGLKNGDIVQGVNGLPITKPEQAFAAYQQLKNESQITLEVRRGNNSQIITYELK
jgi:general secretion pathway protein C